MSKWNRWKLIHKKTGKTFKQLLRSGQFENYGKDEKLIPVLLDSGRPAYYNDQEFYPYMRFLNNKEWEVVMTPASPEGYLWY